MEQSKTYNREDLLRTWEEIGKENTWIAKAHDPEFSAAQLTECVCVQQLQYYIGIGNWNLGKGFYFRNLCFINQIDGGDEWLTIRNSIPFESVTAWVMIRDNTFINTVAAMLRATDEQIKSLTY